MYDIQNFAKVQIKSDNKSFLWIFFSHGVNKVRIHSKKVKLLLI